MSEDQDQKTKEDVSSALPIDYTIHENQYYWRLKEISSPQTFIINYTYKENIIFNLIIKIILALILVFSGIVITRITKQKRLVQKTLRSIKILNEKEKMIVEQVLKKPGINQSELKNKVGLTKSNISKIIAKLEFRALIERKSEGKINRLYLGEKLR